MTAIYRYKTLMELSLINIWQILIGKLVYIGSIVQFRVHPTPILAGSDHSSKDTNICKLSQVASLLQSAVHRAAKLSD